MDRERGPKVEVRDSRVLTIAGMAAGFTVLFGAPLGAAVFALELLHRRGLQYYEALLPAVLGSLAGYGGLRGRDRRRARTGVAPPVAHVSLHVGDLGWAVVAGVGGALVAIAFTYADAPRSAGVPGGSRRSPARWSAACCSPRWG